MPIDPGLGLHVWYLTPEDEIKPVFVYHVGQTNGIWQYKVLDLDRSTVLDWLGRDSLANVFNSENEARAARNRISNLDNVLRARRLTRFREILDEIVEEDQAALDALAPSDGTVQNFHRSS